MAWCGRLLLLLLLPLLHSVNCVEEQPHTALETDYSQGHYNPGMGPSKSKCIKIPVIELCKADLRYNYTSLPNPIGFQYMPEIKNRISGYKSLMMTECSKFVRFFICSMYIPLCSNNIVLQPCKDFCIHVKGKCSPLMKSFAYSWPEDLKCDNLPMYSTRSKLCIRPHNYSADVDGTSDMIEKLKKLQPGNGIGKNWNINGRSPLDRKNNDRIQKFLDESRKVRGSSNCAPNQLLFDQSGGQNISCLQKCDVPVLFRRADRQFAEVWMTVWAGLCMLSTLLTFLTFAADSYISGHRFQYPERPIVYLSACYFFYSVAFLLRAVVGGDAIACRVLDSASINGATDVEPLKFLVKSGQEGTWCTIIFLLLYFFTMAAALWWVVLCVTWFLSAARRWGHEGVENVSSVFHMVTWAVPAVKSIVILIMHRIDGDELTGLCFVGAQNRDSLMIFVILPLILYLFIGCFFLLWGFCSLLTVRKDLKSENGSANLRRLEKLMAKIGVFSILYTVPAVCVVGAYLYEYFQRPLWEAAANATRRECIASGRSSCGMAAEVPSVEVYMLKTFMSIAVGITSGVWVWGNKKSIDSWRMCLSRAGCCSTDTVEREPLHQQRRSPGNMVHYQPAPPHNAFLPPGQTNLYGHQVNIDPDQYTYAGSSLLNNSKTASLQQPVHPNGMPHKMFINSSCV